MILYVKNMVCNRCKMVVKSELEKLGLHVVSVELGEVNILETNIESIKNELLHRFQTLGFDLIDDKKSKTVEKIKNRIIDLVQNKNSQINTNLSDYLSVELAQDYGMLSTLFSEAESTTIEKYFISQKIEKVKELLVYDEMTLNEIAYHLNYSSTAYLSNQFKKVTGLTPSYFKQVGKEKRKALDKV